MANKRQAHRDAPVQIAAGVDALIARLRDEGVSSGRSQADQIVAEAQAKADAIVKQAEQQANQIVSKAREESENLKRAAHEALDVAFRDTTLALKGALTQRFTSEVQRLVGGALQEPELLERLILEVVGRGKEVVDQAQQVDVLLPTKVEGLDELSRNPEELRQGVLTHFVRLISQDLMREGVTFGVAQDNEDGLRLRLVDQNVVLDLSDRAIAAAILEHLQPRFRALLEGVVK